MGQLTNTMRTTALGLAILGPPCLAQSDWNVRRVVSLQYPALAAQARIEGRVEVQVLLHEDGSVRTVSLVSGNAILSKAACENVTRWRFGRAANEASATKESSAVVVYLFKLTGACDTNRCPTTFTFDFPNSALVESAAPWWQPDAAEKPPLKP